MLGRTVGQQINGSLLERKMALTSEDLARIQDIILSSRTADDLTPFLRDLAKQGRLSAIPEAIDVYANSASANRTQIRHYLAARIPGILVNRYWPVYSQQKSLSYSDFINYTAHTPDWADEIKRTVLDSGDLSGAVERVEDAVRRSVEVVK